MISFNKYIDETIARTKTVCIMANVIAILLEKVRTGEKLTKAFQLKCEQMLAEHHAATHDKKGQANTEWYNYLNGK